MAASEWLVMAGYPDGSFREAGRAVVEGPFEALQTVPAGRRTPEMFAVRADRVHAFLLLDSTQPSDADLVRVLEDGSLVLVRPLREPPPTPEPATS